MAHRGASADFPENTVEAFRGAFDLGATWVELDARRTANGALVVAHDAQLADGRVIVEVRRDDLPATVPSLAEALDACEGMGVNIEIKNSPADPDFDPDESVAAGVVALLADRAGREEVLISSFSEPTLAAVREMAPHLDTAWLFTQPPDDVARLGAAAGHRALHPYDLFVDAELIAEAHGAGLDVNVWTVDDPARMADLVALGVDGICTNRPDVAARVVNG